MSASAKRKSSTILNKGAPSGLPQAETASANSLLLECAREEREPDPKLLLAVLDPRQTDLERVLSLAEIPRRKYAENKVRLHILNNVRNGHCSEDCRYCAQRKDRASEIPAYPEKSDEEILAEAKRAAESGAFRYCMVSSGRGLTPKSTERYARLISKIKSQFAIEVCLSAGLVFEPAWARALKEAGLDRYNHNLNTSEAGYAEICSTHTYQDRMTTLAIMKEAGVSLCSGIIAGMGESDEELVDLALALREKEVPSIPINFFLPVPGHAVSWRQALDAEKCLRILALFRLANPSSEIRMAAGREHYLGERQKEALRVSNSLFVSGYLNVAGSNLKETLHLIYGAGFEVDSAGSDLSGELRAALQTLGRWREAVPAGKEAIGGSASQPGSLPMKDEAQLRPFKA